MSTKSLSRSFQVRVSGPALLLSLSLAASVVGQTGRQQRTPTISEKLPASTIEARRVIGEATASALKIRSEFQRGILLDEIGAAQAKAGLLDAAVVTANRAYPHQFATMKAIGEQLGNSNDLAKAKAIGLRLKGGDSSTILGFFARRLAEKGKVDEALATTKYIRAPEVRRSALEWIANYQAANSDYAGVRKTLALAKVTEPNGRSEPYAIDAMTATDQFTRGDVQAAQKTIASIKSPERRFALMMNGAEILLKRGDRVAASEWLESASKALPAGSNYDFSRYLAIPIQVRLAQSNSALKAAERLSPGMRASGYMAIAVVCAEAKDVACVKDAAAKMRWAAMVDEGEEFSDFSAKLMTLNVTAALIANDQMQAASELLVQLEQHFDDVSSSMSIEPRAQLQRVFMLALQNRFEDARWLALTMRPNTVSEVKRGTALRTIALLETKKNGVASSPLWVSELTDSEDRAYALLGIAEGLLEYNDPKLHYSVIQVH